MRIFKKLILLFIPVLILCTGCGGNNMSKYEFVEAGQSVNIFSAFDNYGGQVTGISIGLNGEMELGLLFNTEEEMKTAIEQINVTALDRARYDDGKRVLELLSSSKTNAIIYVENIRHLKCNEIQFYNLEYFLSDDNNKNINFVDVFGNYVPDMTTIDMEYPVIILNSVPPVKITLDGNIVCTTSVGRTQLTTDSITFVGSEGVIVFKKSYTALLVVLIIGSTVLILIAITLIVKIKYSSKEKKLEKQGE